ncbi:MAG TPA: DoxX family protein [Gemmatimonadales bacterium]|nr:DoxX family protein [Gemmatimonadales bacterium]
MPPDYTTGTVNGTLLDKVMRVTHVLLRVGTGLLFMQHGAQKLFGEFGGERVMDLATKFGLAGVLELVGGAFLVLGFLTRPVALLLAGEMAVAYAMMHAPQHPVPIVNKGELALLYMLVFLFLGAHGAGVWSVDAARRRRPRR